MTTIEKQLCDKERGEALKHKLNKLFQFYITIVLT